MAGCALYFIICRFQKFIRLNLLGLADSIPCQGLLSLRHHILRTHQYFRTTHLYFGTSLIPKNFKGPQNLRTIRAPLIEDSARAGNLMEPSYFGHTLWE